MWKAASRPAARASWLLASVHSMRHTCPWFAGLATLSTLDDERQVVEKEQDSEQHVPQDAVTTAPSRTGQAMTSTFVPQRSEAFRGHARQGSGRQTQQRAFVLTAALPVPPTPVPEPPAAAQQQQHPLAEQQLAIVVQGEALAAQGVPLRGPPTPFLLLGSISPQLAVAAQAGSTCPSPAASLPGPQVSPSTSTSLVPFFLSGGTPIEGIPEWQSNTSFSRKAASQSPALSSPSLNYTPIEGVPERAVHLKHRPASKLAPFPPPLYATPMEGIPERCTSLNRTPWMAAQPHTQVYPLQHAPATAACQPQQGLPASAACTPFIQRVADDLMQLSPSPSSSHHAQQASEAAAVEDGSAERRQQLIDEAANSPGALHCLYGLPLYTAFFLQLCPICTWPCTGTLRGC